MSASNFEWIFNDSELNLGSNINDDRLHFRTTYNNSRLVGDGTNYYNVNSYESIIYTNLEHVLTHNNSFTLSLTLQESFSDITKPVNLFTLGYHTKGSKNTCITVGRKAATGDVVLGTINDLTSIKGTPSDSSSLIDSDVSYEYVLVHNNLEIDNNRFHLYINETGSSGYSLICDSSGLANISILQPKLFIGSSLWTNEPEWNHQFDLCDVTLTSNIRLTVNETIYPVDVVVPNSITEQNLTNNGINNIYLDEKFSVSFKSKFRFSPFKTYIYVTSTTDYGTIQLQYDSYMYDNILLEYEYVFNGTITDKYNSGTISYMFDLNGTIYNNKSAIATQLNVTTTSSPPSPPPTTSIVTITGIPTADALGVAETLEINTPWVYTALTGGVEGDYIYEVVPNVFIGAIKPRYVKNVKYDTVSVDFHTDVEVLVWLQEWNPPPQSVIDDLELMGFVNSTDWYTININYPGTFKTYSKTYLAGQTFPPIGLYANDVIDLGHWNAAKRSFTQVAFRSSPGVVIRLNESWLGTTGNMFDLQYIELKDNSDNIVEYDIVVAQSYAMSTDTSGWYSTPPSWQNKAYPDNPLHTDNNNRRVIFVGSTHPKAAPSGYRGAVNQDILFTLYPKRPVQKIKFKWFSNYSTRRADLLVTYNNIDTPITDIQSTSYSIIN